MKKSPLSFLIQRAGGFLFPQICIACKKPASGPDIKTWLCKDCISALRDNLSYRSVNACPFCSLNKKIKACTCGKIGMNEPYESMFSLFDFDSLLSTIIHEFKYSGFKSLAFTMGRSFSSQLPQTFFDETDLIIPVPLHFLKTIKRGYNQAEHLAKGFIVEKKPLIPIRSDILKRRKNTKSQTALSRKKRLRNMTNAFFIPTSKQILVKNKNILIVDDVITTGATTKHCSLVLRQAGANRIRILSLARD